MQGNGHRDLLFEIGTEEIPAAMLARALVELPAAAIKRFAAARLAHGPVRAIGTPRRLALIVKGLIERQPDLDELVVGPPASVAYSGSGELTKVALAFATKNGLDVGALRTEEVPGKKGVYIVASRHVVGSETRALLSDLLRELAEAIAWPKTMRWGWSETAFVRPVQWLVVLYGDEVVNLSWAGQVAGRQSRGHRMLAAGPHTIASADAYVDTLRAAKVIVDPEERRSMVRAELDRIAQTTGLAIRKDDALVDEVIHLGELPVGVSGTFDPSFLKLPEEMIVTAMRTHQRYFAMEDGAGTLANHFATIAATAVADPVVVARGNEKVLASRLADAAFFFGDDRKHTFDEWNAKLGAVVFQAKLGDGAKTIGDKVTRLISIVRSAPPSLADVEIAAQIARYCKADLASRAVGEFPELQGVMGKHYARHAGFDDAVADGIEQHWWPKGQGAQLPHSDAAALVAIADRMDTIVGCFAVGLEPSGSGDPFGLRRAAIGIWQIALARRWGEVFAWVLHAARHAIAAQGVTPGELSKLEDFFRARLRGIFVEQGIPPQDTDAALAQAFRDPVDARARALACAKISKEAREVFKRVANILDEARAGHIALAAQPDPARFVSAGNAEHALYAATLDAQRAEAQPRAERDYATVFESLERLRPTVAAFFDKGGVRVMDPDPALRDNRLALLNWFVTPYMSIADVRLLASSGGQGEVS